MDTQFYRRIQRNYVIDDTFTKRQNARNFIKRPPDWLILITLLSATTILSFGATRAVVRLLQTRSKPQSHFCFEAGSIGLLESHVPINIRFDQLFTSATTMAAKQRVCIIGSGNWGSAISKIVGTNAKKQSRFEDRVTMYVYEEIINGKKLTEIINETHENVKYLPGHKLPENVVAVPDVLEAAKDADILIFVVPHQFIHRICSTLFGKIKSTAVGLSLIKGFDKKEGGGIALISHIISRELRIPVSVLMGANLASEVADEMFCETTIGCKDKAMAPILRDLIQTSYFRVVVVEDVDTVECCGALKNIVACGAGFVDGLNLGDNTKAAVIRLGLMEMIKFVDVFFPGGKLATFFESCGVADLITTCYGGRNRRVSEAFVKTGKSIEELEKEMLNGQKLQGPFTAEEVNYMLKAKGMDSRFPLFTAIHRICVDELKPTDLIECIRSHPEHMDDDDVMLHSQMPSPKCHL